MKTAYITGATGFIGTHLLEELNRNGVRVTTLVRPGSQSTERLKDADVLECGMDDYPTLQGKPADVFYHLAWEGATGPGRDDEALQLKNVSRTLEALKAAKRIGCKRFVALGTVYEKLVPQIMSAPEHRKMDFYLLSKLNAHQMSKKLAEKLGIEYVWATIFQPIGKYIKNDQVMAYVINGLLNGNPPELGPCEEPFDITAVEDIAKGLRLIGECDSPAPEYYIGSGDPQLFKDYLAKTKEILGSDTDLKIGARPDDGLRFSKDWYDISALQRDTGYSPSVGFDEAVKRTAGWLSKGE